MLKSKELEKSNKFVSTELNQIVKDDIDELKIALQTLNTQINNLHKFGIKVSLSIDQMLDFPIVKATLSVNINCV